MQRRLFVLYDCVFCVIIMAKTMTFGQYRSWVDPILKKDSPPKNPVLNYLNMCKEYLTHVKNN